MAARKNGAQEMEFYRVEGLSARHIVIGNSKEIFIVGTTNFAVFVDLENAGAKESMLNNIIEKVKIRGDILLGKVYGYTDRYSSLKECLLSNTFSVVPSLRYGKNQKNNLDIQLVIDAMEVAYTNPLIDSFCIVSGDSDYMPLVGRLKAMGKHVLGISRSEVASGIFIKACSRPSRSWPSRCSPSFRIRTRIRCMPASSRTRFCACIPTLTRAITAARRSGGSSSS